MAARDAILIVGPTAGGKTALSIALANQLPGGGVCLCADSMQVYRGMDIGTAKPTADEQAAAPHDLLDIADPADDGFSVAVWLEQLEARLDALRAAQQWPVIVGGTNLYIQTFLEGLFDGPPPAPELRAELSALSRDALRARLEAVDPDAATRIHPNDTKRTIRAIEVFETTGTPLSAQQREWHRGAVRDDVIIIGLDWPVEAINRRINARVRAMMDDGLLDEVRTLHDAGALGTQAAEALGYKQLIDHLEGRCSLDDAVEQIKIRTRRFAKQQRTWLRRFRAHPRSHWIAATDDRDATSIATEALDAITRLTTP